jgi:hypothetical protein
VQPTRAVRRTRIDTYLFFFFTFALIVFLTHAPYLDLPFYWDELGRFIPAALDLFAGGVWIPSSTVLDVHAPGLTAYLATVWHAFGYSIPVTRLAMLLVASACAFTAFLLAIQLCRKIGGTPAFSAVLLLLVSPLFYTQAMLAQPDLPATLLTLWALLLFLQNRFAASALVSVALVLVNGTGLVVPAVLGCWLAVEGKRRWAAWFAFPALALAAWLLVLWRSSGHPFGSPEFARFNLLFPLHPVHLGFALLRRAHYLFFENFHWVGWIAIAAAWRRSRIFRSRPWRVAATLTLTHVLAVTLLGGATLERHLMPVLPLIYIAMAAAWSAAPSRWTRLGQVALMAGLLFSLFWNSPFPYPFENNLALVDFVRLQQSAAAFLERKYPDRTVTTAWPLSSALSRPEYGYVNRAIAVKEIESFGASSLSALDPGAVGLFVLYSRQRETAWDPHRIPFVRSMAHRLYGYEPQVPPLEIERSLRLVPVARWDRRGQWLIVFAPKPLSPSGSTP